MGILDRVRYGKPVIVVSGLPRSGTSMAMRMLQAAGIPVVADGVRSADEDNPRGYFEDERVKDLESTDDAGWLREARGKAIKIVSFFLKDLPASNRYRVIFMRRDLAEVLASQAKMLDRRDEEHDASDDEMIAGYRAHLDKVAFQLRYRKQFDALWLDYAEVVADPEAQARRIDTFLGGGLDVRTMAEAVDPALYRNKREELETAGS